MTYQDIHVAEVERLMQTPGLIILDMRDSESRRQGELPGALPPSEEVISNLLRRRRSNPAVLVYCYHGNSSRELCAFLGQLGLERVYNLNGGWQAWELWPQCRTL